jgi:murein DD-endopeptidase MepM/ murein hydrolase activator NlpD
MRKEPLGLAIVPEGKARTRYFRIRAIAVVAVLLVCLGGFAGYFIPFNSLTVDAVEQNQKKNLAEQNRKLFKRIHAMAGTLKVLEGRINRLDAQRGEIEGIADIGDSDSSPPPLPMVSMDSVSHEALLSYIQQRHELLKTLARKFQDEPDIATHLPVILPVGEGTVVTARFGEMRDPFTGAIKRHYGIDFGGVRGTPVRATASGRVVKTEVHNAWGRRVEIAHDFGFTTVYAHLNSVAVRTRQQVKRGDVIGTLGASGLATGPHLHYEIRLDGKPVDPQNYFFPTLDPSPLLAQAGPGR